MTHQHSPGIYFDLDEELYHADHSLGSGSVRSLAKCPIYYWRDSHMNPLREESAETPALLFGRALHKMVLEGPEAFQKSYICEPSKENHPDCLDTVEQMRNHAKTLELKLPSKATKSDIICLIKEADPGAKFFDDILAECRATAEKTGATIIKRAVYERVIVAAAFVIGEETIRAAFKSGRPEMSIFWEENGVRLKARLDYVRLGKEDGKRVGIVTDLKSFANVMEKPPEQAVVRSIAETRLDIQAALYGRGLSRVSQFFAEGKVYGAKGISQSWLDALAALGPEDWRWYWCFYEKEAPIALLRRAVLTSPLIQLANIEIDRALQAYLDNMERFGTAWRFIDPMPDPTIDIQDMPKWLTSQQAGA